MLWLFGGGCASAQSTSRPLDWHAYFSGEQIDDIVRAWMALRTEHNVAQSLRDCAISYSGGRGRVATIHFLVRPVITTTAEGHAVGPTRNFVVNVQGDNVHVFPEGQGEIVGLPGQ